MLHVQELPPTGGDTLFANMPAAWDSLSAALRQRVATRRAEHTYLAKYDQLRERSPWRTVLSDAQ